MAGDRVYSTRETVAISSCVWGYHVYKDRWKPKIGENLACVTASGNLQYRITGNFRTVLIFVRAPDDEN